MIKNFILLIILSISCYYAYHLQYPSRTPYDLNHYGFQLENALKHVQKISKKPHHLGTLEHQTVQRYIVRELQKLGATVTIQKSTAAQSNRPRAAPIENIMAHFPAKQPINDRWLLLMAHYDSAKQFSKGAADDASGVAVILEAMRDFLTKEEVQRNNILVLITDGEELGLLGAEAFVKQRSLAKKIGAILNFEARGSSGPAIMIPETNGGNYAMLKAFQQADIAFPASSSLSYEFYKIMPNNTDLSAFRNLKNFHGYNFAFIDNSFTYHTAIDDPEHLSLNSLIHQGIQLQAMLDHLAHQDLTTLNSQDNAVFFTVTGIGLFVFSAAWHIPIILTAWLLFGVIIFQANKKGLLKSTAIFRSTLKLTAAMGTGFIFCGLLLFILYRIWHPQLQELLQGFPYLGHLYLYAMLLCVFISPMLFYRNSNSKSINALPAIFLWLLLFSIISLKMPGACFLLIPLFFALALQLMAVSKPKFAQEYGLLLLMPAWLIVAVHWITIVVALNLSSTPYVALFICLFIAMFQVTIARQSGKTVVLFFLLPLSLFVWAGKSEHFSPDYPLPSSISYLYDTELKNGHFYSFDQTQLDWHQPFLQPLADTASRQQFNKKYKQRAKQLAKTSSAVAFIAPQITVIEDKLSLNPAQQKIQINVHKPVEILQVYSNVDITVKQLTVNRAVINNPKVKAGELLFEYHLDGQKSLTIDIELMPGDKFDWQILSYRFDLLKNKQLNIPPRPDNQTPKPFIHTDNIVVASSFQWPPSKSEEQIVNR